MKNKKKTLFILIPISLIMVVVMVLIGLYLYYGIHIYDNKGRVRGFEYFAFSGDVFQKLKKIYDEPPFEDEDGNLYEYIKNFDGIDTCDATVKYCFYDHHHLKKTCIYLSSTEYSTDDLYNKIIKNFRRIFGVPNIHVDKHGEPYGNVYWSINRGEKVTLIYVETGYFYTEGIYQVCIEFVY